MNIFLFILWFLLAIASVIFWAGSWHGSNNEEYDDYAEDYEEIYPTYEEYLIEQGEIDHRNIMRELVGELKGCTVKYRC